MKDMAQSNLIYRSIMSMKKSLADALPLARRLKEKYPDNYNFSFALADIFSSLGQSEEAFFWPGRSRRELRAESPLPSRTLAPLSTASGKNISRPGDYEKPRKT